MAVTPNRPAPHADELSEMAIEELDAACGLLWVWIKAVTPWGDTYDGMAPSGRAVERALIRAMSGAKSSVSKTVAQPFIMQMVRSTPMPVSTLCCLSGS